MGLPVTMEMLPATSIMVPPAPGRHRARERGQRDPGLGALI